MRENGRGFSISTDPRKIWIDTSFLLLFLLLVITTNAIEGVEKLISPILAQVFMLVTSCALYVAVRYFPVHNPSL